MTYKKFPVAVWLIVALILTAAGCGGSGGSSSSGSFTPSDLATIAVSSGATSFGTNYQVVLSRSGTATYTNYTGQPPTPQTGSGTISASLTSQFFTNLDAVAPNYQAPPIGGGVSGGISTVSYSSKIIILGTSTNTQQQALYDEANTIAKALGLP